SCLRRARPAAALEVMVGECAPPAHDCPECGEPRVCGSTATWFVAPACPYLCQGGGCAGECRQGDRRCHGTSVEECDATAHWATRQTCPTNCAPGACSGPRSGGDQD